MLLRYLKNKKESQKALGNKVTIVAWKDLMSVAKAKRFNQEGKATERLINNLSKMGYEAQLNNRLNNRRKDTYSNFYFNQAQFDAVLMIEFNSATDAKNLMYELAKIEKTYAFLNRELGFSSELEYSRKQDITKAFLSTVSTYEGTKRFRQQQADLYLTSTYSNTCND